MSACIILEEISLLFAAALKLFFMSFRLKIGLAVLGLVIVLISLAALIYAYWPMEVVQVGGPVSPTLFAPP